MNEIIIKYGLYLAAFLFCAGMYVTLTKRSAIFVLIGVELMLNGANLVLVIFSSFDPLLNGQIFAIFSIVFTVCEVSVALAILLNIYRRMKISNLDELTQLRNSE